MWFFWKYMLFCVPKCEYMQLFYCITQWTMYIISLIYSHKTLKAFLVWVLMPVVFFFFLWNWALRWYILALKIHIFILLKWGLSDEIILFSATEILTGQRHEWVLWILPEDSGQKHPLSSLAEIERCSYLPMNLFMDPRYSISCPNLNTMKET